MCCDILKAQGFFTANSGVKFKITSDLVPEWPATSCRTKGYTLPQKSNPCQLFLFSWLRYIPPCRVAQALLLSYKNSQKYASIWKTSVSHCGGFRLCIIPKPSTAKDSRTQEQTMHICSSRYQRMMICVWKLHPTAIQHWQLLENFWT